MSESREPYSVPTQDVREGLPQPSRRNGFPVAPMIYPKILRRIVDALDALNALGSDGGPTENNHFVGSFDVAIFNNDAFEDRDDKNALVGWLSLIDENCWVFVPFVPEIDGAA